MRALSELLADDVEHTIVGDLMFVGGEYRGKAETLEFLKRAGAWFQGRGRITVRRVIVDGEWAAIEWERAAKYWNGRDYRREYAVVVQVRDGKLQTVREY